MVYLINEKEPLLIRLRRDYITLISIVSDLHWVYFKF